jgi:hypothetical protein
MESWFGRRIRCGAVIVFYEVSGIVSRLDLPRETKVD